MRSKMERILFVSQRGQISVGHEDVCARASSYETDANYSRLRGRSKQGEDEAQMLIRDVLKALSSPAVTRAVESLHWVKLSLHITPGSHRIQTIEIDIRVKERETLESSSSLLEELSKVLEEQIDIAPPRIMVGLPCDKTTRAPEYGRGGLSWPERVCRVLENPSILWREKTRKVSLAAFLRPKQAASASISTSMTTLHNSYNFD
jgi:hypothetical protein